MSDTDGADVEVISVNFLVGLEGLVELENIEGSSGKQETGGIGSGVVGQSSVETEFLELLRCGLGNDLVSLESGEGDLGDDLGVGDSGNESVFWSQILVDLLGDHFLSCQVVSLSFSSSLELSLESLEVSLVLNNLYECHL